jgi:hypothetical protein
MTHQITQEEKDRFEMSFRYGVKLAAAGLNLIGEEHYDLGKRLIKLGSSLMDGYALAEVLPFAFSPQDIKMASALCVDLLDDELNCLENV